MASAIYTDAYRKIVEALREVRNEAGLHQAQLAAKIGKDQSYISNIERGQRRVDVLELYVLARALGIEPGDLYARITRDLPKVMAA